MMGQVVQAALNEAHSDLSVSEPTNERTQQLLCFINQTLREINLKTGNTFKMSTDLYQKK